MRENQAIKNHIPMTYNQKYIIAVQDDTTEKELLQIENTLRKNIAGYGASDVCVLSPLERFMKNSNHEFQQTVMMYLPVCEKINNVLLSKIIIMLLEFIGMGVFAFLFMRNTDKEQEET